MEESKRKHLENQLRKLFNAHNQETSEPDRPKPAPRANGTVRVIRRRKGRPDQHILTNYVLANEEGTS
jgi:hypothetical protein